MQFIYFERLFFILKGFSWFHLRAVSVGPIIHLNGGITVFANNYAVRKVEENLRKLEEMNSYIRNSFVLE